MSLTGIEGVEFVVQDMPTALRFLDDWGLARQQVDPARASFTCADGSYISIEPLAAAPAGRVEAGPTVAAVVWGAPDQQTVESLARELARDRAVTTDAQGTVWSQDDMGLRIGIRVSQRKSLSAAPYQPNTPGFSGRVDRRATVYERAVPQEISHVVFGVPDLAPVEKFYRERLGFLVSDRYIGRAVFLRAAPAGNHHHLFLLNSSDFQTHFNHICFKVREIHEVIGGGQFIAERGWETREGPGRHIVSSACFWYFRSPVAGGFEYAADDDMVVDGDLHVPPGLDDVAGQADVLLGRGGIAARMEIGRAHV